MTKLTLRVTKLKSNSEGYYDRVQSTDASSS